MTAAHGHGRWQSPEPIVLSSPQMWSWVRSLPQPCWAHLLVLIIFSGLRGISYMRDHVIYKERDGFTSAFPIWMLLLFQSGASLHPPSSTNSILISPLLPPFHSLHTTCCSNSPCLLCLFNCLSPLLVCQLLKAWGHYLICLANSQCLLKYLCPKKLKDKRLEAFRDDYTWCSVNDFFKKRFLTDF